VTAGHYLGHAQTLALMKSEFLYPELADRTTPAPGGGGPPDIYERANKRVHEILSEYYPTYISPEADARIRERFHQVRPEDMKRAWAVGKA